MSALGAEFNTGLTEEQISAAFQKALSVMTNEQIESLVNSEASARLEADNNFNTAIYKMINSGDKNLLNITQAQTQTINGVVFTVNSDYSITLSTPNGAATGNAFFSIPITLPALQLYFTGMPGDGGSSSYRMELRSPTATGGIYQVCESQTPVPFTPTSEWTGYFNIRVSSGYSFQSPQTVYPMISERWKYAFTNTYVPYRPSYQKLYEMVLALQNGQNT